MRPYFEDDVDDAGFLDLIPPRVRHGAVVDLGEYGEAPVPVPANAVRAKVDDLVRALNVKLLESQTRPFVVVRLEPGRTAAVAVEGSSSSGVSFVREAEVWLHRAGCRTGRVLRVQVSATPDRPPFMTMTSARLAGTVSEDAFGLPAPGLAARMLTLAQAHKALA